MSIVQYQATARASGQGRNGHVESDDFKLKLASPKELGGDGKGKNPEQLFAMGYAGQSVLTRLPLFL